MRNSRVARRLGLLAVPTAALVCLAVVPPAHAATAQPTPGPVASSSDSTAASGPITHPESDTMGSTIRAHETPASTPGMAAARPMAAAPAARAAATGHPYGMDVSNHQPYIDWEAAFNNGARFVYMKATEGTGFIDRTFTSHYSDAYDNGMFRGAYHFALPDRSSGAAQANYFMNNGGMWSADGKTLPPMLDIEYNPYGETCYGMAGAPMVNWIREFSTTVHNSTGRYPTIYTTRNWWNTCTGSDATFGSTNPLFVACYCDSPGSMPAGWARHTIWQYDDQGIFPGDQDLFNGSMEELRAFASDGSVTPPDPTEQGTATVVPEAGEAGGVVGVTLSGWAPNTTVTVTLDGSGPSYPSVIDSNGGGFALINLPADTQAGGHTVVVRTSATSTSGAFQVTPMVPFSIYQILSEVLRFLFGI